MPECGEGVDALARGVGVGGVDDAPVDEVGFELFEVVGTEVVDELVLGFEALDVPLVEHTGGGGGDVAGFECVDGVGGAVVEGEVEGDGAEGLTGGQLPVCWVVRRCHWAAISSGVVENMVRSSGWLSRNCWADSGGPAQ